MVLLTGYVCLSGYPVWKSLAIGVVAGVFWLLWIVVSIVHREQIARRWANYRRDRAERPALVE